MKIKNLTILISEVDIKNDYLVWLPFLCTSIKCRMTSITPYIINPHSTPMEVLIGLLYFRRASELTLINFA